MATMQDKETFGRARLSFAQEADVDEFVSMLARFEAGEIGPDEWRAFRLLRGTYGQRQTGDAQMMRVKIPQGLVDAAQLEVLAGVGERYSRGFGHITTRQNVQFHFVKLHDAELAMRELAAAGITTREACGNSVRNITACPYAGVAPDEPFDVTPYAESLTRYLLRHPLSSSLPRKFKIAFEGCADDHVGVGINDIGWHARVKVVDGAPVHGFRVTVAGGTATMTRAGLELHEFLPADQMFDCAEAIIRVFHRLGDYKHKQKNRLKFLVKALGWDGFRAEYEKERAGLLTRETPSLPFERDAPPVEAAPPASSRDLLALDQIARRATATTVIGPGIVPKVEPRLGVPADQYRHWAKTNVRPQKQSGYSIVIVATLLGDLTSAQMRLLGDLASSYGDGTVRVTVDQNLVFRWVKSEDVEPFYRSLAAAGLARPGAGTLSDVTSCPGAESCKLAVTQSRGLGRVFADHLL
jgi:sulfite reductase beta subunit-like hemoprotein